MREQEQKRETERRERKDKTGGGRGRAGERRVQEKSCMQSLRTEPQNGHFCVLYWSHKLFPCEGDYCKKVSLPGVRDIADHLQSWLP